VSQVAPATSTPAEAVPTATALHNLLSASELIDNSSFNLVNDQDQVRIDGSHVAPATSAPAETAPAATALLSAPELIDILPDQPRRLSRSSQNRTSNF
jgi:hypothetical protein